jgi:glycogenin glucosyltransferase
MSTDPQLFQPPKTYPEPPESLSYQVPTIPAEPERLKPIFPWEARQTQAVRVFPEDVLPSPQQALSPQLAPSVTTDEGTQSETAMAATPAARSSSPQPFASYSRTNVWDEIPGIQRYVANILQKRRGRTGVFSSTLAFGEGVSHEGAEDSIIGRRPSIILTDFPSEIERPSLPVTPAPIRRPTFWGEERNAAGELPPAEGVPDQSEWDPTAKLAELQRKQSLVLAQGPISPSRVIPNRPLIGSEPTQPVAQDPSPSTSLSHFNFGEGDGAESKEDDPPLSPTS